MNINVDAIISGKNIKYQPMSFDELPKEPNSEIYNHLVHHDRPDLWKSYLDYSENTDLEHWEVLRSNVIPNHDYLAQKTVWQKCELSAEENGKSYWQTQYGLTFPSVEIVTQILTEAARADYADDDSDRPSM